MAAARGLGIEAPDVTAAADEDDDGVPSLSEHALQALREFLAEQEQERPQSSPSEVHLLAEDWRLSQFWYDETTARAVANEVDFLVSAFQQPPSVACVACPTLFAYLKSMYPGISAQLFEYDTRFEQYGEDFIFYDYNQAEELPAQLKHAYQIIVADPPYLSKECLGKVAQTISFLSSPHDWFLLLLTGEVQRDQAADLLNVHPCGFRPQHTNKLGNEFRLFTNYNPGDRMGGWEGDAAEKLSHDRPV